MLLRRTASAGVAAALAVLAACSATVGPLAVAPRVITTATTRSLTATRGPVVPARQIPRTRFQAAIHPRRLYFGVASPHLPDTIVAETAFAAAAGKTPNLIEYYQSFYSDFDITGLRATAARGQLPLVTWEPWNYALPHTNPFSLRAIATGSVDTYLKREARLIRASRLLVAVRLAPEMNGNWFPWGQNVNGNTPAEYVAMYRHVHDVFRAAGASNVIWVWSPNAASTRSSVALRPLYPGNAYVDIAAVDGYLDETTVSAGFAAKFDTTFAQFSSFAPTKAILIAETSVRPSAAQIPLLRDLMHGILTTPRVIGFTWFDYDKSMEGRYDWLLENRPSFAAVFRRAVASPRFGGRRH